METSQLISLPSETEADRLLQIAEGIAAGDAASRAEFQKAVVEANYGTAYPLCLLLKVMARVKTEPNVGEAAFEALQAFLKVPMPSVYEVSYAGYMKGTLLALVVLHLPGRVGEVLSLLLPDSRETRLMVYEFLVGLRMGQNT